MAILSGGALNGAFPVFQRELGSYFRSPVATIYLVVFLLAALGCPFFLGNFYRSNHAGLEIFFAFHPWLYLFLVPAMGMSVWAEEFQHSTILLLFTLPVSVGASVVAKFFAAWAFLGLALLLTFPIVGTVFYLGHPDPGPILTGYLGSFLMAGVYLAITTCTSAIGRNQIVSYVLSTILCLVMVLLGQGVLTDLLNPIFPVWLVDLITQFSFSTHFHALGLGVIDSRDIIYFLSLIAFFLIANTIVIQAKMGRFDRRRSLAGIAQLSVALIAINVISYCLPVRADITADKAFTISESTRSILSSIKGKMLLKFYFSKSNDELSPEYKIYAQRVQDLLKEYVRLSDHKLSLEVIDPQPDTYEDEWAQNYGVQKKLLPDGTPVYFGLAGLMWDREFVIPAFDPDRAGQLEYDLTQRILHINNENPRRIGILGSRTVEGRLTSRFSGIMSELRRSCDVSFLPLDGEDIPKDISVLLVLWTNEDWQENENYFRQQAKIERFLQQGGKLLMMVDPHLNRRAQPATSDKPSSLAGKDFPFATLFKQWGVQFSAAHVVGDLRNAGSVQVPGLGSIRYPFLIHIGADGLSRNVPVTKSLEKMAFLDSGALLQTAPQIEGRSEFVPLIVSSGESGSYDFSTAPLLQLQKDSNRPGSIPSPLDFFSHGANRLATDLGPHFSVGKDSSDNIGAIGQIDQKLRSGQQPRILAGLVRQGSGSSQKPPVAIIVADADFIADDLAIFSPASSDVPGNGVHDALSPDNAMALTKTSLQANEGTSTFGNASVQQPNDNINFVLNAIDYLSLNDGLAGIRSRGQSLREFTRVRDLEKVAQEKFLDVEKSSQDKLNAVTQKLHQTIRKKEGDQKFLLTAKQQSEIKKYLDEEAESKKELRSARSLLRENIKSLGNRLLLLNLLPVPLLVALCGGFYIWRRSRKAVAG